MMKERRAVTTTTNQSLDAHELFKTRFCRCKLLAFIADRVLEGRPGSDTAVQNCWLKASRNPPAFEDEGAFRSWLLRGTYRRSSPYTMAETETWEMRGRRPDRNS